MRLVRSLVLLGVLALVAAAVAWWLLRDTGTADPDDPSASPTVVNEMATGGVESSIADRLTARYGREVLAVCPPKVDALTGTEFTCDVFFADDEETRTTAKVEITGGGGQFEWTTENAPDPEESGVVEE